jgi:hypothetical protein
MSALRNQDVLGGPAVRQAVGSALARLAARALALQAGPTPLAELPRGRLLREARMAGARCRADGTDIIAVIAEFQACRAEVRRRRRLQADARSVVRLADRNLRADGLLDDVLVAIVRGYEERLEPEPPSMPPSPTAAALRGAPARRRAPARSLGSSKRE